MKRILKTIFFAFCLISLASCEDDIDPKVAAQGFALRTVDSASPLVLVPQNDANNVISIQWDKSDNGGFTSVSTYIVEIAESGTNFAGAVQANAGNNVTTADRTYTLTVGELNTLINKLPGYECGQEMSIDIRIKSTLGGSYYNNFVQYSSNVVTVVVTPYSSLLPTLAFSGSATITADTPRVASSSVLNSDYEGYMYLTPGAYKFYKPNACGDYTTPTAYGDDDSGEFNKLVVDGSSVNIITAGYYLVKADLTAAPFSYSVRLITWALFGTAKQTFPLANTVMTYNQTTKVWTATGNFATGYGMKFRSNGSPLVLGKFVAGTVGTSRYGGEVLSYVDNTTLIGTLPDNEVSFPEAKTSPKTFKNYTVTLDLSKPRNYTYTITENQ